MDVVIDLLLDGADVTDVDDRESIVQLAAYWPLGFLPSWLEGVEDNLFPRVVSELFISLFGKCLMELNAMVRLWQ